MSERITCTPVKTITSHVGVSRFLATCEQEPGGDYARTIGQIPRPPDIPSPYAYSPVWSVYAAPGGPVVIAEVAHKRYVVYRVTGPIAPVDPEA